MKLAAAVLTWLLAAPANDRGPIGCGPGELPVSRPLSIVIESAWPWRPARDSFVVTPGDTVRWRYAVATSGVPYLLRAWAQDAGGRSCSTWVLLRPSEDNMPPAPVTIR